MARSVDLAAELARAARAPRGRRAARQPRSASRARRGRGRAPRPPPRARRGRAWRGSRGCASAASPSTPELGEQLAVEVGVAEPDHGAAAARPRRAPRASTSTTSAVPSGARRADQLDAGLGELAHLAALRADGSVGAGEVAEAERRLGGRVAVGDQAGDRDRHVGAHRQQLARLVEEAIGDRRAALARRARAPPRTRSSGSRPRRSRSARTPRPAASCSARSSRISSGRMSRVPGGIGCVMRTRRA